MQRQCGTTFQVVRLHAHRSHIAVGAQHFRDFWISFDRKCNLRGKRIVGCRFHWRLYHIYYVGQTGEKRNQLIISIPAQKEKYYALANGSVWQQPEAHTRAGLDYFLVFLSMNQFGVIYVAL